MTLGSSRRTCATIGTKEFHLEHTFNGNQTQSRPATAVQPTLPIEELTMQFMAMFTFHPGKAETPAPADLREAEFEMVHGLYMDGLVQQIWLRGDGAGACMIVEAPSTDEVASKLNALPEVGAGFLRPPVIVPLMPYWGFAPRS
jgi:hypothetical protein